MMTCMPTCQGVEESSQEGDVRIAAAAHHRQEAACRQQPARSHKKQCRKSEEGRFLSTMKKSVHKRISWIRKGIGGEEMGIIHMQALDNRWAGE